MDIKEQILVALGLNKDESVELGWQGKSEDGTIFVSTAEELEAGEDISVLTEDGTTILLPIGTYKTDKGLSFRVEEEGVVAEVIESETEEEDTMKDDKKEADEAYAKADFEESEHLGEDRGEDDDEVAVDDWEGMEKRIKNLEDAIADIKSKLGETDSEEMSEESTEEASDKPKTIKKTEVVEFSAEDEIKRLKEENEKLKTELSETPAEAPLNTNAFSDKDSWFNQTQVKQTNLSKRERILNTILTNKN
jgi:hypothetical protein